MTQVALINPLASAFFLCHLSLSLIRTLRFGIWISLVLFGPARPGPAALL